MLNYFVDSYLWCFFFNHNAGNVGSSYVNVNRNKGREQRKKINYISLNLLFFINKTKQQLFVANLKTRVCPCLPPNVSWHLFCGF